MNYEIKIKKDEEILSLPKARVTELLSECGEEELKVLIAVAAEGDSERARELSGLSESDFSAALSFWRGAKLVSRHTSKKKNTSESSHGANSLAPEKSAETEAVTGVLDNVSELPEYTSADIKRLKGRDALFNSILDEAQQTFGKVFNNVEMNYIIAMRDHLSLDGEYILMLLEYFRREGKPLCYAVRVADSLVKKGICDPLALETYLKHRDSFKGNEGRYRDLFGIGTRALTAYEEKYFTTWSEEMQMPFDLVRVAFERTVEKKGTPQKSYINGILKKWHEAGILSVEALDRYEQSAMGGPSQKSQGQSAGSTGESTFDVDDFFTAALERMYGKSDTPTGSTDNEE